MGVEVDNFFVDGERDKLMLSGSGGFCELQWIVHGMLELMYPWSVGEMVREVKNRGGSYSSNMLRVVGSVGRDFDSAFVLGYEERVLGLGGKEFTVNGIREGILGGMRGELKGKLLGEKLLWEGGILVSGGVRVMLKGGMLEGLKGLSARDMVRYSSFMLGMSEVQGLVALNDVSAEFVGSKEQVKKDLGVMLNGYGGFLLRVLNDYVGLEVVV